MRSLSKAAEKKIKQLRQKKFRDQTDCFLAEGDKLIRQLSTSHCRLRQLYWTTDDLGLGGDQIDPEELKRISAQEHPANSLAIFQKAEVAEEKSSDAALELYLEEVQDPGNLGTILRTANWFGHQQIWMSTNSADPYSPKAVQSSMGAIGSLQLHRCSLEECLTQWQKDDRWVVAADMDGSDYRSLEREKIGIIIGNEGRGLSETARACAHELIHVPRGGSSHMESLNAAVSAAILMAKLA
jgi:TrmH family RNA methyltransferase